WKAIEAIDAPCQNDLFDSWFPVGDYIGDYHIKETPMARRPDPFNARSILKTKHGEYVYYDLNALKRQGVGHVDRLPFSIRVLLEAALRNVDGFIVTADDVSGLANWNAKS